MYDVNPPLFPEVIRDEFFWVSSAMLPSWKGFQIRNGPYGAISSPGKSDGMIHLCFTGEESEKRPLNKEEMDSIQWVIDNEKSIHDAVMNRLVDDYEEIKEEVLGWCDDENQLADILPTTNSIDAFKDKCGVVSINVHPIIKSGVPFIGVELGCTWEDEHGAGLSLHGDCILRRGAADAAIIPWDAEEINQKIHNETVGCDSETTSLLKNKNIPDNIEGVRQLTINLEHVAQVDKVDLIPLEQEIEEYLADLDIETNIVFLRSAVIEDTSSYLWKFSHGGHEYYAIYSFMPEDTQSYCARDPSGLSPEQFVFACYHNII